MLRAVAVILVFGRHEGFPPLISQVGWAGVDLFFVLSGFLVSGLLFREYQQSGGVQPFRFLLRRGFKIYPQFYLLLGLTVLVDFFTGQPARAAHIGAEAAFVQNYFQGLWGHTWSLAVEEHFYILLTVTLAVLARRGGDDPFRALVKWIPAFFALILALRLLTYWHDPTWSYYSKIYPSHLRLDSLMAGVLLSYFNVFHTAALRAWVHRFGEWLAPVSLLMLMPIFFLDQSNPFVYTVGLSLVWMGFGILLLIAIYPAKPAGPPGIVGRGMAGIGRVSYAFYLWHLPVLDIADHMLARAASAGVPISVGLATVEPILFCVTLLFAFATTWAVEAPFLRLRDRLVPSIVRSPLVPAS